MSEAEFQPISNEPSETELRIMLEEREREIELARQQTSRKFSLILVGFAVMLVGAIFLFPSTPVKVAPIPIVKALTAAPIPTPLNPDPNNTDPGLAKDLKPFMVQRGAQNGTKEDIRFAMQLLNFMDAPSLKSSIPVEEEEPVKKP